MKINIRKFGYILVFAVLLTGCQSAQQAQQPSIATEQTSETHSDADSVDSADSADSMEQAASYIEKAFDTDPRELTIQQEQVEDTLVIKFMNELHEDEVMNFYQVFLREGYPYPTQVYHFHNPNTENIDLAAKSDFEFNEDLISIANDFVKKLYNVDCANANTIAYVYKNKIAVRMQLSEYEFFDVRFAIDNTEPVGCLFANNQQDADATITMQNAKIVYSANG